MNYDEAEHVAREFETIERLRLLFDADCPYRLNEGIYPTDNGLVNRLWEISESLHMEFNNTAMASLIPFIENTMKMILGVKDDCFGKFYRDHIIKDVENYIELLINNGYGGTIEIAKYPKFEDFIWKSVRNPNVHESRIGDSASTPMAFIHLFEAYMKTPIKNDKSRKHRVQDVNVLINGYRFEKMIIFIGHKPTVFSTTNKYNESRKPFIAMVIDIRSFFRICVNGLLDIYSSHLSTLSLREYELVKAKLNGLQGGFRQGTTHIDYGSTSYGVPDLDDIFVKR